MSPVLNAPLAPDLWGPLSLALAKLDARTADIFKRRVGLYDGEVWTLYKVGREYRLTRGRIRQIEKKTLRQAIDRDLLAIVEDELSVLDERSVWVFRLAGGIQASWPPATLRPCSGRCTWIICPMILGTHPRPLVKSVYD